MKILFTGATGLAGKSFYEDLCKESHEVSVKDRSGTIDCLIHFASPIPINEAASTWDDCAPEIEDTIRLLHSVRGRVSRILLASSCAVYGSWRTHAPITETHRLVPLTGYALTQYAREQIVHAFCAAEQIPFVGMRLGYVYGPGVSSDRAVVKFLQAISSRQPIRLKNAQTSGLPLIHVKDISRIGRLLMSEGEGLYNLASPRHISLTDYVRAAMNVMGRTTPIRQSNDASSAFSHWYSIDRLVQRHGIQPDMPLESGIRTVLEELPECANWR